MVVITPLYGQARPREGGVLVTAYDWPVVLQGHTVHKN